MNVGVGVGIGVVVGFGVYVGVAVGMGVAVGVGVGVAVGVGVVVGVSADKHFWPEMIRESSALWSIRIGPEAETAVARESIMMQTTTQILRDMGFACLS